MIYMWRGLFHITLRWKEHLRLGVSSRRTGLGYQDYTFPRRGFKHATAVVNPSVLRSDHGPLRDVRHLGWLHVPHEQHNTVNRVFLILQRRHTDFVVFECSSLVK